MPKTKYRRWLEDVAGIRFGGVLPEIIITGKRKNKH